MPNCRLIAAIAVCVVSLSAQVGLEAASFQGVGLPSGSTSYSTADAISLDGRVVSGNWYSSSTGTQDGYRLDRFTGQRTLMGLGEIFLNNGKALDLSDNGAVVVGERGSTSQAFRYTGGVATNVPHLASYTSPASTLGGISGDGAVVVGQQSGSFANTTFRY